MWHTTHAKGKPASAAPSGSSGTGVPVPVTVAAVAQKAMPLELRTFGTVEPLATATVKPQITGVLTNVFFREGQDVKEGDPLFAIDARPAAAALKQAEGNQAKSRAQLANAPPKRPAIRPASPRMPWPPPCRPMRPRRKTPACNWSSASCVLP